MKTRGGVFGILEAQGVINEKEKDDTKDYIFGFSLGRHHPFILLVYGEKQQTDGRAEQGLRGGLGTDEVRADR